MSTRKPTDSPQTLFEFPQVKPTDMAGTQSPRTKPTDSPRTTDDNRRSSPRTAIGQDRLATPRTSPPSLQGGSVSGSAAVTAPIELSPRLTEQLAATRQRKAQQHAVRAELEERRQHGVARRHAVKLRHLAARRDAEPGEQP